MTTVHQTDQDSPSTSATGTVRDIDANSWRHRHLLNLEDLTADEIRHILSVADRYYPNVIDHRRKSDDLLGRCVANLFFEDSTRTRGSFTRAAQLLSADVIEMSGAGSSVSKGETTVDTALNIEAMGVDAIVIRHRMGGAPHRVAEHVNVPIINAGDGRHEHPTQGLLDTFTLKTHWQTDDFTGRTIAIVGDIKNSRVARSNIHSLIKLGARVVVIGPPTLAPKGLQTLGCEVSHDFDEVLPQCDAVMMLRVQFERLAGQGIASPADYRHGYALTRERTDLLKEGSLIMHPGPMNRGLEINSEVADSDRSVILEQVTHGVAIRMAVLRLLIANLEAQRS